jgi:hypothetical protein
MADFMRLRGPGYLRPLTALFALLLPLACADATGPGTPSTLEVVEAPPAEAHAGTVVTGLVMRVKDAGGRAVPGVVVRFEVVAGGGSLPVDSAVSAGDGRAALGTWRLGDGIGQQVIRASADGVPPVDVELVSVAGSPYALHLDVPPSTVARSGVGLEATPIVSLRDRYGNEVPRDGVEVTVHLMGGTGVVVSGGSALTDDAGRAHFSDLSLAGRAGSYAIRFRSSSVTDTYSPEMRLLGGAAAGLQLTRAAWSLDLGMPLTSQPVVEVRDAWGNLAEADEATVTASVAAGSGQIIAGGTASVTGGRATFQGMLVEGEGPVTLRFAVAGLPPADAPEFVPGAGRPCPAGPRLGLDALGVGEIVRLRASASDLPACLDFHADRDAGETYLLLFEDIPQRGSYGASLFPGTAASSAPFMVEVRSNAAAAEQAQAVTTSSAGALPPGTVHGWDFGAGPVFEAAVAQPPGGAARAELVRGGTAQGLAAVRSDIAVGDTVRVHMEGIDRLEIERGYQHAVVRHVSDELVIAEDVRLATLTREGGQLNTPLTEADMEALAAEYAAYGAIQGDRLFDGRYNGAIEDGSPARVIAVHSLMYSNNIWGYTYSGGDYFIWDFWVGTDGRTRGLNQHPHRVADHLITHEIAHMRHWGLMERAGRTNVRGHRWLVEGFARHTERWSVAARLLGTQEPSRTGNVVLPRNPAYGNSYVRDAVPTFLQAGADLTGGYGASSYLFDYLADQVAWRGGDWLEALVYFLVHGGEAASADGAVKVADIGPHSLGQLITRARVALYADDLEGFTDLPAWTQYHQYQLRASRPAGSAQELDPIVAWPRVTPGTSLATSVTIRRGGAWGMLIDGEGASADGRYELTLPALQDGVVSVTRLR